MRKLTEALRTRRRWFRLMTQRFQGGFSNWDLHLRMKEIIWTNNLITGPPEDVISQKPLVYSEHDSAGNREILMEHLEGKIYSISG